MIAVRALFFAALLIGLALGTPGARAETLPLPPNLIDVRSDEGGKLLFESEARAAYMPLSVNFLSQKTQSYCGVASIVMVLNALDIPAPTTRNTTPITPSPRTTPPTRPPTSSAPPTSSRRGG